jgi:hypothetical protein
VIRSRHLTVNQPAATASQQTVAASQQLLQPSPLVMVTSMQAMAPTQVLTHCHQTLPAAPLLTALVLLTQLQPLHLLLTANHQNQVCTTVSP